MHAPLTEIAVILARVRIRRETIVAVHVARIALLFLSIFGAFAAAADGGTFVITSASRPRGLDLSADQRVFVDPGGGLTIDTVRALPIDRFVPVSGVGKLDFGNAYWTRVAVRSDLPFDMQYIASAMWWDFLDIYVVRADASLALLRGGLLKTPAGPDDRFYPTFVIRAGETVTLFTRFASTGAFHAPDSPVLFLSQAVSRHEAVQPFDYFQAIVVGMLFALAIYNLIVALSTRDSAYFLYSLYLFALSVSLIGLMSPFASKLNQFLMPGHPWLAMMLKRLSDPAAWVLLLLFDRAFLETRRYLPAWDRIFLATIALFLISEVGFAFGIGSDPDRGYGWLTSLPLHLIALLGLVAGVLRYRQGFIAAKYFVAAQVLLSLGLLAILQQDSAWNPLQLLPDGMLWRYVKNEPLWIAAAAEAIIFSMGLAYRMNALKAQIARQALEAEQERKRIAIEHAQNLEIQVAERTQELRREKENASNLLHNILPSEVAEELMTSGSTEPRRYEEVTILFTDFKGFTNTVGALPAKKVVEELNDIFQHFDDIVDACGLEKIKTIGDSYMAAGGLPRELADHAERCVDAALRMQRYLDDRNRTSAVKWNMRAGIHSGAVVAGVVGKRKFTYDLWGDTVNIASRMESAGAPGRVNLSAYAYDLVKSRYKGEYRGKLDAKGKGEIDMYFVVA